MTCLARNCTAKRDDDTFLCTRHWHLLPEPVRLAADRLLALKDEGRQPLAKLVFDHYWEAP